MNRISKYLFGAAALALLAGCSDEIVPDDNGNGSGNGTDDGPGLYIGVNFSLPGMGQGTRSITTPDGSNNGTEVGTDAENNVNEVLLILAKPDNNGYIASSIIPKQKIFRSTDTNNKVYNATAKFFENALDEFYQNADPTVTGPRDVNVFVICNPKEAILDAMEAAEYDDTSWLETGSRVTVTGQQTEGSIWSPGNFLMSNAEIATKKIPNQIDTWDNYTTEDKCFNLSGINGSDVNAIDNSGAVKVERAAARFDFRDASTIGDRKYEVVYLRDENTNVEMKDVPLVGVQLNKMALVNMSNQCYYLPRVSPNGYPTDVTICGKELPWFTDTEGQLAGTPGNYVVSYYTGKPGYTIPLTANFATYFNYPFFNEDGTVNNNNVSAGGDRWGTVRIEDVLKGEKDNWTDSEGNTGTYRVWRYCTENALPAPYDDTEVNGNSTGIVFKAKMYACEQKAGATYDKYSIDLLNAINNVKGDGSDPMLFSINGLFYSGWDNVFYAAIDASFTATVSASDNTIIQHWNRSNSFYKAVFGEGGVGDFKWEVNGEEKTLTDNTEVDPNSPFGKYRAWQATKNNQTLLAFKNACTLNGFTLYEASVDNQDGAGYYCYYYYWNRHNDNGRNGIMGPMEFAVVRNNVYKLAVTAIHALGHPRISENDPDKPTPDTPDEETNLYISVSCEVLPWTVRVNNAVFD